MQGSSHPGQFPEGFHDKESSDEEESIDPQSPIVPRTRASSHSLLHTANPPSTVEEEEGASSEESSSSLSGPLVPRWLHGDSGTEESRTGSTSNGSGSGSTEITQTHSPANQVEDILTTLTQKGGVRFLNYLLAKAVSPDSESLDVSKVREWSYRDIMWMNKPQQKEWKVACQQELDSLYV